MKVNDFQKLKLATLFFLMYVQHSSVELRERQLPCANGQEVNDTPALSVGGPGFNSWPEGPVLLPNFLCFPLFFQGDAVMLPRTMP